MSWRLTSNCLPCRGRAPWQSRRIHLPNTFSKDIILSTSDPCVLASALKRRLRSSPWAPVLTGRKKTLAQLHPRNKPPQKASAHVSIGHDRVDHRSSPAKPSIGVPFLETPWNQTDQPRPGPRQHDMFAVSFLSTDQGRGQAAVVHVHSRRAAVVELKHHTRLLWGREGRREEEALPGG